MRIFKLIAAALAALAIMAPAASAKPVSPHRAERAVAAANWWYSNGLGITDETCTPGKRYGTICRTTFVPNCQSTPWGWGIMVTSQDWWVSSTHGKITAVPWGHFEFDVWGLPAGEHCDYTGQTPYS